MQLNLRMTKSFRLQYLQLIQSPLVVCLAHELLFYYLTTAWLAQLGERRSTEREVAGSNPGRTNTQGL